VLITLESDLLRLFILLCLDLRVVHNFRWFDHEYLGEVSRDGRRGLFLLIMSYEQM